METNSNKRILKALTLLSLWIVASAVLVASIFTVDASLFIASICLYTAIGVVILDDEQKEDVE